jgi:hypothetical protein
MIVEKAWHVSGSDMNKCPDNDKTLPGLETGKKWGK